jgi:tetratricopeptide (TPR) repeat protein
MKTGEYLYKKENDGLYHVCRILRLDIETDTAHVSSYLPQNTKPTNAENLQITVMHAPVRASSYVGWQPFAQQPVTENDLIGFYEYLKQVDFGRYLQETNQNMEKVLDEAKSLYRAGWALQDNKDFLNAIDKYRQAFDLLPVLFEAKDNEAFCHMSLGNFEAAINCFKQSIDNHGHTALTDFSIGECYFKMQDYKNAYPWFEKAQSYRDLSPKATAALIGYLHTIKTMGPDAINN